MKTLLVISLLSLSALVESSQKTIPATHAWEINFDEEIEFEKMVKVYDYQGKLMKEYELSQVVNNKITVSDHILIEESDFAFDYLGDYYYFSEELLPIVVN